MIEKLFIALMKWESTFFSFTFLLSFIFTQRFFLRHFESYQLYKYKLYEWVTLLLSHYWHNKFLLLVTNRFRLWVGHVWKKSDNNKFKQKCEREQFSIDSRHFLRLHLLRSSLLKLFMRQTFSYGIHYCDLWKRIVWGQKRNK